MPYIGQKVRILLAKHNTLLTPLHLSERNPTTWDASRSPMTRQTGLINKSSIGLTVKIPKT